MLTYIKLKLSSINADLHVSQVWLCLRWVTLSPREKIWAAQFHLLGDPTSVTAATDAGKNYDNYVITVKGFTETAGELSSVQDGCDNTDATYYALLKRCVDRHLFTSLIILFVSINILCFIYLWWPSKCASHVQQINHSVILLVYV